jgi:dihydrofolate reductase
MSSVEEDDVGKVWYEGIVAMNPEGIIGVTRRDGTQYIPWLSKATRSEDATRSEATRSGDATRSGSEDVTSESDNLSAIVREDMRHFRKSTIGNIVIMGRKTFESLPTGSLPNRTHIVLTRKIKPTKIENVYFTTIDKLDETVNAILLEYPYKKVFVCGGEDIYRKLLHKCYRLCITEIPYTVHLKDGEKVSKFVPKEEWDDLFQRILKPDDRVFDVYFRK